MVRYFTRSTEGEEEFRKINKPYENEIYDDWYEKFLKITKTTKESDVKRELLNVKRLVLPDDYVGGNVTKQSPREYLIYNIVERRKDALGNEKHHTHGDLGKYPIPVPKWVIKLGSEEEGYEKMKVVEGIDRYDTGYSMPYSKENVDKLAKMAKWDTRYSIQQLTTGHRITVDSLKDFRDGQAEHLLYFGHIANKYEEQQLEDIKAGKIQQIRPNQAVRSYG